MAAGEGRRLRPISERWAKPVLPVDGRPVIVTLLHELADAGLRRVTVVTGHLAEQVERLVEGCEPRLEIRVARQLEPLGSADAVRRALEAGAEPPLIVSAADTVFRAGDVERFREAFAASDAAGAVAYRRDPAPGRAHAPVRLEDGAVVRIPDDDPANPLSAAPLWGLSAEPAALLDELPGPPYELAVAFQRAIDAGKRVIGVEIGPTRTLTEPADLVRQNFPYLESNE